METIRINGITLCHKHSTGFVMSTLPDVCKTPTWPVPHVNIAFSRDLMDGTTSVVSHGGAMNGIKGSRFFPSYGDEPGVGGGVVSGVFKHEATWLMWSPDVFMEGRPVTRLTDKMLMNKGNTVSLGGYYTGPVMGADRPILDQLCDIACDCKNAGRRQNCVERELIRRNPDPKNGLWPETLMDYSGDYKINGTGNPSRQRGVPTSTATRVDAVQMTNGKATTIVEMKFAGDDFFDDQEERLKKIAAANRVPLRTITVEQECKCDDDDKKKEPVPVPVAQPEKKSLGQQAWEFAKANPGATAATGLAVVGIVACSIVSFGTCAAAIGIGGTATALAL